MTMSENEKREYIKTARDNLFVEAGAGAGKTTMLADRIVNQIADGEAMRSFVVITFTKAAAQELLDRIVTTMRKRLDLVEGKEKQVLEEAMQRIDELHVSTIHSFCRTILMEYAFDAGFVLDPEMLDEQQETERMKNFFRQWKRDNWKVIRTLSDSIAMDYYLPLYNAFVTAASVRCPIVLDDVAEEQTDAEKIMRVAIRIAEDYHAFIDADALTMTNDQLLYKAGKLVKENDVICEKLRAKYHHLYVDEFQDTDDIQVDMIWKLAEKQPGVLRDNCLFVVGDPKQSIYRFRGAQVELFYDIRERMEKAENATVLSLENNFRSDASIIQWVNTTFTKRIQDYTSMRSSNHAASPYTGVFRCTLESENANKRSKSDVGAVCDLVEAMCAVHSETTPGDFLVITKDKSRISEYVKGFAAKGIPTAVRGKIDVESSEILNGYVRAFHALADRSARFDQAANAQLLSGAEFSDLTVEEKKARREELLSFAEASGFYFCSAGGAARLLYDHPEVYMPKEREITKTELRSAKAKLLQCIDTCIANTQGGLRELANAMVEYMQTEIPREIPLESKENAVAIMNVHQVKGLAGKIVIIADRRQVMKDDGYDNLRIDGNCLPTFKAPKDAFHSENMVTYDRHPELLELNETKRLEEWIRLEYVAATRARIGMIFMKEQKEGAWFTHEDYDIASLPDIMDIVNSLKKVNKTAVSGNKDLQDKDLEEEREKPHDVQGRCSASVAPSSLEKSGNSGYGVRDASYVKEDRPAEDLFGTVMHRCFEMLVNRRALWLNRESAMEPVKAAVRQAMLEFSDEIPEEAKDWEGFLCTKLNEYCRYVLPDLLKGAVRVRTEYPFTLVLSAEEERPEFLQDPEYNGELEINGTMDLVVVYEDGHAGIYDYKSDARNGMRLADFRERMQRKYANQIALYAYALKKSGEYSRVDTELIDLYRYEAGGTEHE